MDDMRERLRREIEGFEPSPGGFEKTIHRVRARQRMRRAGAATVGLTLTAFLVAGLVDLGRARPADGAWSRLDGHVSRGSGIRRRAAASVHRRWDGGRRDAPRTDRTRTTRAHALRGRRAHREAERGPTLVARIA